MLREQRGSTIIWVLLFLLVITSLLMSALTSGLMETKMSNNFADQNYAFMEANRLLLQHEQQVAAGIPIVEAAVIPSNICGITMYRITSCAVKASTKTQLESTLAKLDSSMHCEPKPKIVPGRQSWREKL